jgi:hypothetical protein
MLGDPNKDADIQDTLLGTYQVQGTMVQSTCGPSAFGSTDPWNFSVKLSRDGSNLYWYTGDDAVEGAIDSDGQSFSFATTVNGVISNAGTGGKKGCTMVRDDGLAGKLAGSGDAISGFTGSMTYQFSQTSDSDCSNAIAQEGATALPCSISYSLVASKQ